MYFNLTFLVSLNTKKKHPTVSRHMSSDVSPSGAGWQRTHLSASSSAEWSHYLLQSLTSNTPWQEFRMEIRNEALCALGKLTQQVSRELDNVQRKFMNPIFTTSRGSKAVKSFRETSVLPDSQPQSPKIWAYQHVTPSPQSHAYWPPLCPWSSPLEQKRGWPPACSPQQVLPRKWTPTTCCSHSKGRHWHFSLPVQMGYPVVESSEEPLLLIFQLLVKMWVLRRPVCDKDGKTYAS